jgi:glycosyltransferase 2 family protein
VGFPLSSSRVPPLRLSRRGLVHVLALAATAVFVVLFVRAGSLGEAWHAVRGLPPWVIAAGVAAVLAANAFAALRWVYLLRASGIDVPARRAFQALAVGSAANNVFPARGGDLVRLQAARRTTTASTSSLLGTLLAERIVDALALGAWVAAGALAVGAPTAILVAALSVVAATGTLLTVAVTAAGRLERVTRLLPPRAAAAVADVVAAVAALRSKRLLAKAILASFALRAADVALYAVLAHGLGIHLGLAAVLLVAGVGSLALVVPATAAGIGTFDYLVLVAVGTVGLGGAAAAAYVLTVHAFLVLPVTLLGAVLAPGALARRRTAAAPGRRRRTRTAAAAA